MLDGDGGAKTSTIDFAVLGRWRSQVPTGASRSAARERAVLSLLIAWAGEVVSSDHLTDPSWGERPPRSNIRVIHNLVSQLRKVLGRPSTDRPGNLPLPATEFIGRVIELHPRTRIAELGRRRFMTSSGAGGVGETAWPPRSCGPSSRTSRAVRGWWSCPR